MHANDITRSLQIRINKQRDVILRNQFHVKLFI